MTPKQQLLQEIENTPTSLIPDVLNYLRFLKAQRLTKQSQTGVMQFAGMLADTPDLADGIIENAEAKSSNGLTAQSRRMKRIRNQKRIALSRCSKTNTAV